MNRILILGVLAVLSAAFAVWYLNSQTEPETPAGGNVPFDYREVPSGFEKHNENLYFKPLVTANSGPDSTRFEQLSDTGISFKNFFDRKRPVELVDTGSGVAIGDYNRDGLPDVYLVGSDTHNKLFRNLGEFKFEDVTSELDVEGRFANKNLWGAGATFVDVDNDGDLDLFVCNMVGPNLLYINQGDGTFDEQSYLRGCNYIGASKSANFCDYDRDGDLDFYLVTYQDRMPEKGVDPVVIVDGKKTIKEEYLDQYMIVGDGVVKAGQKDILYQNQGDGTFVDVTDQSGVTDYGTTLAAVWLDFDGDGWQDVYASNDFHSPDRLFRNNQDGTFTDVLPDAARHTPWFSMGNDAGDLNNDGLDDLITSDMSGTSHFRRKVDMGDMGDSAFFLEYGRPRQYMKNALFINSGTGRFLEAAGLAGMTSTDWTWSPRLVDLNNDGKLDVFVTNGHIRDIMNADIVNQFAAFDAKSQKAVDEFYGQIPPRKETNLAFKNLGNLKFQPVNEAWGLDFHGISHGAAFSDLDRDGDLDLIVNNFFDPASVYRNESNTGARVLFEFRCEKNNFFGVGTRVEVWIDEQYQSKTLRSTRGYLSSDAPSVHFGFADNPKSINRVKVTWPDGSYQEFQEVPTGRQYLVFESPERIVVPNEKSKKITWFQDATEKTQLDFIHRETKFDDYQREPLLPYKLSELGGGIAWGDVNGDDWPDLFCGGAAGQAGKLFLNQGGNFREQPGPWQDDSNCEDMGVLFFDADGDGDDDLFVVSGSNEHEVGSELYRDRLYFNQDGKFEKANSETMPDLRDSGSVVAAADFDRDGDLDLFVGGRSIPGQYPKVPKSRLLKNENGKFIDVTSEIADSLQNSGLVNSAVWSDINDDGWIDLVLAPDWGPITVFQNNQGKFLPVSDSLKIDGIKGWWHGIVAADLDNDGDMDFVVTNQGLNTKYHADETHPHRLYFSDFDNNGTLDLVENEYEGDTEFPARGRSCSSNSMPFVGKKFETYEKFAVASLMDVYEPSIRQKPFREVNYLESAIVWNRLDEPSIKRLEFQPLPRMAQISPAFGIAIGDFDSEGEFQDIFIGNNFFASQPETGFMDGGLGLVLKHQSAGDFEFVWPNQSGVNLNAANYSVAAADFNRDGRLDVAVGANNDRLRLLTAHPDLVKTSQKDSGARIQLRSNSANSVCVGAKVVLIGKDFVRAYVIQAGGSYLSQSNNREILVGPSVASKIQKVMVRWPDGKETEHPFVLKKGLMRIQQD